MKNKEIMKNKKGFTMLEVVTVVAVISILGLIIVPGFTGYIEDSKNSSGEQKARAVYTNVYSEYEKAKANGLSFNQDKVNNLKDLMEADDIRIRVDEKSDVIAVAINEGDNWYYYPNQDAFDNGVVVVPDDTEVMPPITPSEPTKPNPTPPSQEVEDEDKENPADFYHENDIVSYNGERFICLKKIRKDKVSNPADHPNNFKKLVEASEWKSGKVYNEGDMVMYDGVKYVCIRNNNNNQWTQPKWAPSFWKEA